MLCDARAYLFSLQVLVHIIPRLGHSHTHANVTSAGSVTGQLEEQTDRGFGHGLPLVVSGSSGTEQHLLNLKESEEFSRQEENEESTYQQRKTLDPAHWDAKND